MSTCTLCDLPVGDDPVTDASVAGNFCCRGCLTVYRELGDVDVTAERDTAPETDLPPGAETAYLDVAGMHCTTCEVYLEHLGAEAEGIYEVDASYAAGALQVAYDPAVVDESELGDVFSRIGYDVGADADTDAHRRGPTVGRLLVGGFLAMMAMMWYVIFLYPTYLGLGPPVALGRFDGLYLLSQLWVFSTVILLYTGAPILRGALVSLRARRPNVDLLVSLAAVAAYLYSTGVMLTGGGEVYFDVTIVIVMAVSVGTYYEERIRERAAGLLAELTELQVEDARLADSGERVDVPDVQPGDELLVKPGERIPVDGTVVEGSAAIDEALVTGESIPERVEPGDAVRGGTVVTDAPLTVAAGEEATSTLDRIVELLWNIQSTKPSAQRLADKLATVFVPLVLVLAGAAAAWLLLTGAGPRTALLTGLGVLVVSCPCALGLATPLAVAAGVTAAADRGIVVTTPALFEDGAAVETVVFDKTGTLSDGDMQVLDVHAVGADPATVRRRAAAVESLSSHPIAAAIADDGSGDVAGFERHDRGVAGTIEETRVVVGHPAFVEQEGCAMPDDVATTIEGVRERGAVPVAVGWDGQLRGIIEVGDRPRPGWREVVADLAETHRVVVLSGDAEAAMTRYAEHPGVDEVYAGVPPEGKAATVRRLVESDRVAMVGDGSNDAPALAAADVGIAMAGGTQLASDAADAVVVGEDLAAVPTVFEIAEETRRRIRGNLGWAFLYNAVAIPLALAGVLNPLFAAVAMASSSLLVVANSARAIGGSTGDEDVVDLGGEEPLDRPDATGATAP